MVYLLGTTARPWPPQLARVDGSESRPLLDERMTQECPKTFRPAWSPDGEKLAFLCVDVHLATTGLGSSTRTALVLAS